MLYLFILNETLFLKIIIFGLHLREMYISTTVYVHVVMNNTKAALLSKLIIVASH